MRAFTILAGAIACSLLIQAPALATNAIYEEAVTALQNGDFESAAGGFERLIEQTPEWAPGHVALGQCHYLLGRPEQGDESIRVAGKLDPDTDQFAAYAGSGQKLYKLKRFDDAIPPLERALEHAPAAAVKSTALRLAYAYYLAKQYDRARTALEAHRTDHGFEAEPAYYLAMACRKLDQYACALDTMREVRDAKGELDGKKVVESLGRWSHYWALVPENKARRGELIAPAIEDTRAWHLAEPDDPTALRYYADLLLAAGRGEQVAREVLPVAQRSEEDCTARRILAEAHNALGDGPEAERWAADAVRCEPSAPGAHVEIAVARVRQLNAEHSSIDEVQRDQQLARRALESLDEALRLDPARAARVRSLRTQVQSTLQQLDRSEADFVARDLAYTDAVEAASRTEIRQRCQGILWKLNDETRVLSAEDEAYYRDHDCRQFARQGENTARNVNSR